MKARQLIREIERNLTEMEEIDSDVLLNTENPSFEFKLWNSFLEQGDSSKTIIIEPIN